MSFFLIIIKRKSGQLLTAFFYLKFNIAGFIEKTISHSIE